MESIRDKCLQGGKEVYKLALFFTKFNMLFWICMWGADWAFTTLGVAGVSVLCGFFVNIYIKWYLVLGKVIYLACWSIFLSEAIYCGITYKKSPRKTILITCIIGILLNMIYFVVDICYLASIF